MRTLPECKEYFKDVHTSLLISTDILKQPLTESELEKYTAIKQSDEARYNMFCEALSFIYRKDFDIVKNVWLQESLNEHYSNLKAQ